jgi:thiamine-monophosphate kinase
MTEFELIQTYFTRPKPGLSRATLGVGDDCALLHPPRPGMQWAVSCDMLVAGQHFFEDVSPQLLGHKALAVNLSDLAACGAKPVAFFLALALPQADETFLQGFSTGLHALADEFECELLGGDTTRGPLNICITVMGEVPQGQALLRSGAQVGDDVYVSGKLGDASLALAALRGEPGVQLGAQALAELRPALEQPQPRVALGRALRGLVHSAIDISDGLLSDLGHLLQRSQVGARVQLDALPCSTHLRQQAPQLQQRCLLAGGDDYELLFTAAPSQAAAVQAAAHQTGVPVTRIGCAQAGLQIWDLQNQIPSTNFCGFDHFAG